MIAKFRSVRLVDMDDTGYQAHCKKMQFIRNSNRFVGEFDTKQLITAWAERVIVNHLSEIFPPHHKNILCWEELDRGNRYSKRYRELDGVFHSDEGQIYVEIKASHSKSSFRRGKTQINENSYLLESAAKHTVSMLVMADCRCYDSEFGSAKEYIEESVAKSQYYKSGSGLNFPKSFQGASKWLWLLEEDDVLKLAEKYGPPEEGDDATQEEY